MGNRIKGITVEIGGDTTGLDKAANVRYRKELKHIFWSCERHGQRRNISLSESVIWNRRLLLRQECWMCRTVPSMDRKVICRCRRMKFLFWKDLRW